MHILPGSPNPPNPKSPTVPTAYRICHVDNLDFNLFDLMKSNIASSGKNNDMYAQSLAVVKAKGSGYYLINTQGNTTPQHDPDLKVEKVFGTKTVEALFYRG
jgi:hypothetical protein